jgi:hypothetical protein
VAIRKIKKLPQNQTRELQPSYYCWIHSQEVAIAITAKGFNLEPT